MSLLDSNLQSLAETQPALARKVRGVSCEGRVEVLSARDGNPVPRLGGALLHSAYEPVAEARRLGSEAPPSFNTIYGLGFGYHLLERLKAGEGALRVIEPSLELFRSFLEHVDIAPFLPRCRFHVDEPVEALLARHSPRMWNVYEHRPSMRAHADYFDRLEGGRAMNDLLLGGGLKILVVHPVSGGSLPTSRHSARALRNLGHEVREIDSHAFSAGHEHLRTLSQLPERTAALSRRFMDLLGEMAAVAAEEFRPDLVLALAQAPLNQEGIRRLKSLGAPVAFWFVEDFRVFPYWQEVVGEYDHFFTLQQGQFLDWLNLEGHAAHYLPQACFPDVHAPRVLTGEDRARYASDLSFMGAGYYNRQQAFLHLLDFDLKIWGTEWNLNSPLGPRVVEGNRRLGEEEIVKIYNAGQVHINLHSSRYHEGVNPEGDFVNPRTFEIPACGGFQLVDQREELDALFLPEREIAVFHDIPELKARARYFLAHPEERARVALAGKARVLREHTLEHRMMELLLSVFIDRAGWLASRVRGRQELGNHWIEQAGPDTPLGRHLERYRQKSGWNLDTVVQGIQNGEGNLKPEECLVLMVDQFFKRKEPGR